MDYRFWRFYDRRGKNKKLSKAGEGQEKENCEGGGEGESIRDSETAFRKYFRSVRVIA